MTDWKGEKMDTLLIRNGTVVNAENGTMTRADILAEGGWIRKAEPGICDRAVSEIDASGCYVTPGLVDHHTHIYPMASVLALVSQRLWMPGAWVAGLMKGTGPGSRPQSWQSVLIFM